MCCILTMDMGGTKISVGVLRKDGSLLGEYRADGGNPLVVGNEQAKEIVVQALLDAASRYGFAANEVAVVVGNAFILPMDDFFLRQTFPLSQIQLVSEPFINIMLSLKGQPGFTVHSGTGSYVTWYDGERVVHYGGFGRIIGDRGSGYEIGREGLLAVIAAEEGGKPTLLTDYLCEMMGITQGDGFLERIRKCTYPINRTKFGATAYYGKIAPLVSRAAAEGDGVANEILLRNARALADCVRILIEKCGCPDRGLFGTSGGVFAARGLTQTAHDFTHGNLMLRYLVQEMQTKYPALEYLPNEMELWQACYACYQSDKNDPCRTEDFAGQYGPLKRD